MKFVRLGFVCNRSYIIPQDPVLISDGKWTLQNPCPSRRNVAGAGGDEL